MAIFQSTTNFFRKAYGRYTSNEGYWQCKCDKCGVEVEKMAEEAGDAAENAYKEGFVCVASGPVHRGNPMRWLCSACAKKK
jgi:predicted short-subunit dehydrogenase-like oxidoreductase (DUF2520 family)